MNSLQISPFHILFTLSIALLCSFHSCLWDTRTICTQKVFPTLQAYLYFILKIIWLFYTLHLYLLMFHSEPFIPQPTESRPYSKEAYDFPEGESLITCNVIEAFSHYLLLDFLFGLAFHWLLSSWLLPLDFIMPWDSLLITILNFFRVFYL